MGQKPGPIPKDPDQRVRRNKTSEDGLESEKFYMDEEVSVPWAAFEHMFVQGLWESLEKSVNKRFYEPSDWQYARLTLHLWDKVLMDNKVPTAMMIASLDSMLARMLVTEGDRRRLKIEAKREGQEKAKLINAEQLFRERFEQQREAN